MTTLRIITRQNAKGSTKFWIEGHDDRSYATLQAARNAAREIIKYQQAIAVCPELKRGSSMHTAFPAPMSKDFGVVSQAKKLGIPVPQFEIVVAV